MIVNISTFTDAGFLRSFNYATAGLVPISLTGSVLRMHVRARADDATVFIALASDDGDASAITFDPLLVGRFTIKIPYTTLLRLPVGSYVHSLIRIIPITLAREEIWRGTLVHSAGPTRWT